MAFTKSEYGSFFYFKKDDIGKRIANGEFFDAHYKPYMDGLREGDVLVDVGANIGFFSVYCALRGVQVYAFEASPEVTEILKQNVEVNNLLDKISVVNVPLYDSEVELGINPNWRDWVPTSDGLIDYLGMLNSGGLSLVKGVESPYKFRSKMLDSWEWDKISLLKVDTQGADLRVLVGGRKAIEKCRPVVCFEFEDGGTGKNASGDSMDDFNDFFREIGYFVTVVNEGDHGQDYVALPKP